jgi:hypothetical protein
MRETKTSYKNSDGIGGGGAGSRDFEQATTMFKRPTGAWLDE